MIAACRVLSDDVRLPGFQRVMATQATMSSSAGRAYPLGRLRAPLARAAPLPLSRGKYCVLAAQSFEPDSASGNRSNDIWDDAATLHLLRHGVHQSGLSGAEQKRAGNRASRYRLQGQDRVGTILELRRKQHIAKNTCLCCFRHNSNTVPTLTVWPDPKLDKRHKALAGSYLVNRHRLAYVVFGEMLLPPTAEVATQNLRAGMRWVATRPSDDESVKFTSRDMHPGPKLTNSQLP